MFEPSCGGPRHAPARTNLVPRADSGPKPNQGTDSRETTRVSVVSIWQRNVIPENSGAKPPRPCWVGKLSYKEETKSKTSFSKISRFADTLGRNRAFSSPNNNIYAALRATPLLLRYSTPRTAKLEGQGGRMQAGQPGPQAGRSGSRDYTCPLHRNTYGQCRYFPSYKRGPPWKD